MGESECGGVIPGASEAPNQSPVPSPVQNPGTMPMGFGTLWAGNSELLAGIYNNSSMMNSEDSNSASNVNGNDSEVMDQTDDTSNDSKSNLQQAGVMAN